MGIGADPFNRPLSNFYRSYRSKPNEYGSTFFQKFGLQLIIKEQFYNTVI